MDVKALDYVVDKWERNVGTAGADYEAGIRNPSKDWLAETAAANGAWKAAMAEAISKGTWLRGINRAGTGKWQSACIAKGLTRWAPGVAAATDTYRDSFAPFLAALASLTLKPRYARNDPRNYDRVKQIGDLLNKLKETRATR